MDEAVLFKLANASITASPTPEEKIPRNGYGLGQVTAFKILNPFKYFCNG